MQMLLVDPSRAVILLKSMWPWSNSFSYKDKYGPMLPRTTKRYAANGPSPMQFQVMHVMVACLVFGVLLLLINVYQLRSLNAGFFGDGGVVEGDPDFGSSRRPVVWIFAKNIRSGYLSHVLSVFSRVGFVHTEAPSREWDVLWSHDYPFGGKYSNILQSLDLHQKVNHFPGSGFITNKASLATHNFAFNPPAYQVPRDKDKLLAVASKNPNMMWVEKNNGHRGIQIKKLSEMELDKVASDTFVQHFVDNPFLIDNRKFDIGVYTVLTSINPLRVYVFEDEVLIRFCTKNYHPLDVSDVDKYVVGDEYTQPWELSSLWPMKKAKLSRKAMINAHLRQEGKDDVKMWDDINRAIAEVYTTKEKDLIGSAVNYKSSRNFFELVRFDFVLDDKMKIWLMEVNMSPNLSSGAHSDNKLMYEQVVFNLLGLVGVANKLHHSMKHSSSAEKDMLVSDSNMLAASTHACSSRECKQSCFHEWCRLCYTCLQQDEREFLKTAHFEQHHKGHFRRVFPPPLRQEEAKTYHPMKSSGLSPSNQLMAEWYRQMCLYDAAWCQ